MKLALEGAHEPLVLALRARVGWMGAQLARQRDQALPVCPNEVDGLLEVRQQRLVALRVPSGRIQVLQPGHSGVDPGEVSFGVGLRARLRRTAELAADVVRLVAERNR